MREPSDLYDDGEDEREEIKQRPEAFRLFVNGYTDIVPAAEDVETDSEGSENQEGFIEREIG